MDTTGANATTIVTGSSGTTYTSPSWNYNGSTIAYARVASGTYKINTVDVSVNSKGVPVGSNDQAIYTLAPSDSTVLLTGAGPACSATSSTGLVAFAQVHTDRQHYGITELCTMPQSGGTPTVLASYKKLNGTVIEGIYQWPTWSSDDSKIAVARQDSNREYTILIFNASTGAPEDSIYVAGTVSHLEWSRTGENYLAYSFSTGSAYEIYYVTPSTGSTPTTNSVVGSYPTWSPNNSGIMFQNSGEYKLVPFTTATSSVISSNYPYLNWKR